MVVDPAERFSSRVENYVKYRPDYPSAVLECLKRKCGLTARSVIADIGSGTGLLSELFLRNGNVVLGVEPNRDMREAGEHRLRRYDRFRSVPARAEATSLPPSSVDFVTAGQAFHWFDRAEAKSEFQRILKADGFVVLVWNERALRSAFSQAYERMIVARATDYDRVDHRLVDEAALRDFFAPGEYETGTFDHRQRFDFEGLKGRLLSSSYAPEAGHPNHEPMLVELRRIFDEHQVGGRIEFDYDTKVCFGGFRR